MVMSSSKEPGLEYGLFQNKTDFDVYMMLTGNNCCMDCASEIHLNFLTIMRSFHND